MPLPPDAGDVRDRIAVVADSHVGGPGGAVGPLLTQLEGLEGQGVRRLVLLGDIFQAWVGLPAFETPEIRALLDLLARLRGRGMWVGYVEGNRDFFLEREAYPEAFDVIAAEVVLTVGARSILFVHGDGLNDRDHSYRFWRTISKQPAVRAMLRFMPDAWARTFVERTERRLGSTNFKHKRRVPSEVIVTYATRRLAEGHDLLVLGHFHEDLRLAVGSGEAWVLEAWFQSRRVEWVE